MNIVHLHILYSEYYTGIDRYLEVYKNSLFQENGINIHTVYLTNDRTILFPRMEMDHDGIVSVIIPLPQDASLLFNESTFWKSKYMSVVSEMLTPYLEAKSHLIFHYHNLFLSCLAAELKHRFGGKIISHLHCLPWKYNFEQKKDLFNQLYRLYQENNFDTFRKEEKSEVDYQLADTVICLSEVAKDYLINIHKIEESKIRIIQNGLDLLPAGNNREETKKIPEILFVGKITKDKGIFELLNTLRKIAAKGYEFQLRLAGTCQQSTAKLITTKYSEIKVDILGQVPFEKLRELYTACTMGIIPSLHEQCSYVAIEMALFGVPMIVSDVDALSEMFEHEKTALLTPLVFDPDFGLNLDEEQLAKNIIRMIEEPDLRVQLSKNVRAHYEKNFTLDRMINETINVYQKVLKLPCPKSVY